MKVIIITGPPYSGKGTQCEVLKNEYGLTHLSTGECIRNEKERKTDLGKIMSDYNEKGNLVPDEIMKKLLHKIIDKNINASGILLDGYPRTIPQVHDLISVLESKDLSVESVINIDVPHDELLRRAKKEQKLQREKTIKIPKHI